MRCWRVNDSDEDPERLLRAEGQWTEPWGDSEDGTRCSKCEGKRRATYECWSCLLGEADSACPVCSGKVSWVDDCPVCRRTGKTDGKPRHGVSVFPTLDGLYHYMLAKDADLDACVVLELEAQPADDVDFDADQGAMLVIPTEIYDCARVDRDRLELVKTRSNARR